MSAAAAANICCVCVISTRDLSLLSMVGLITKYHSPVEGSKWQVKVLVKSCQRRKEEEEETKAKDD